MSKLSLPLVLASVLLVGCAADSDGDGLTNSQERRLGTDPERADTDGDGLSDFDEVEVYGTDPLKLDTDGDTYHDNWELDEGFDPLDPDDRIYTGYWPYNPDKPEDPGYTGAPAKGDFFWNHTGKDQFGDDIQLYDFLGQDKDIIIDASAAWCPPCQGVAQWLSTGAKSDPLNMESTYAKLRKAIDDGDVIWITILTQDTSGKPTRIADVKEWDNSYTHENVPVITDPDSQADQGINGAYGGYPAGVLLNPNGRVLFNGSMYSAMTEAQNRL